MNGGRMKNPRSLINRNVCRWTDLSVIPYHDGPEVGSRDRLLNGAIHLLDYFSWFARQLREQAAP
jgi:hypothetical protein